MEELGKGEIEVPTAVDYILLYIVCINALMFYKSILSHSLVKQILSK